MRKIFPLCLILAALLAASCSPTSSWNPAVKNAVSMTEIKEQSLGFLAELSGFIRNSEIASADGVIPVIDSEALMADPSWDPDISVYADIGMADDVFSVSFMGKDYYAQDSFDLQIGDKAILRDRAWKMENGHLLVSKAVLMPLSLSGLDLSSNGEPLYDFEPVDGSSILSCTCSVDGSILSSAMPGVGTGEFDIRIYSATDRVLYGYSGRSSSDIVLSIVMEYDKEGEAVSYCRMTTGSSSQMSFVPYPSDDPDNPAIPEDAAPKTVNILSYVFDRNYTFKGVSPLALFIETPLSLLK